MCLLVRPDVPAPARLVRFFLQGLLHTSIFVRKVGGQGGRWHGKWGWEAEKRCDVPFREALLGDIDSWLCGVVEGDDA